MSWYPEPSTRRGGCARWRRGLLAPVLLAAIVACGSDTGERVEVDLAHPAVGFVEQEPGLLRVAERGGRPGLLLEPGQSVDLYVQPEARAALEFAPGSEPAGLALRADDGSGPIDLGLEPLSSGGWRAGLERYAGRPIRLALRNESAGAVWVRPLLVTTRAADAPLLEAPRTAPARLNVVLYLVDTLRADHLSLYGYERETSPQLEKLATRGVVFLRAYAPSSHTIGSIPSLFASRLPSELGGRLDPERGASETLAERFQAAGYRTAAFQANPLPRSRFGYARGFDVYRRVLRPDPGDLATAQELREQAAAWLRADASAPFFLYVQTMDVHHPYDAPAPFGERYVSARAPSVLPDAAGSITAAQLQAFADHFSPDRYDGGVAYADHEIGRMIELLRERGVADRTVVAVTSDHGEPLGQRGEFRHGQSLYEELVHVPLILLLPGAAQRREVEAVVSLIDLGPTLLDLAGIEVPASFSGQSWLEPRRGAGRPAAVGERLRIRTHETVGWFLREGQWKLVRDEEGAKLFDLDVDPGEERDLSAARPIVARTLMTRLMRRSPSLRGELSAAPALDSGLSEEERRELEAELRALGYAE